MPVWLPSYARRTRQPRHASCRCGRCSAATEGRRWSSQGSGAGSSYGCGCGSGSGSGSGNGSATHGGDGVSHDGYQHRCRDGQHAHQYLAQLLSACVDGVVGWLGVEAGRGLGHERRYLAGSPSASHSITREAAELKDFATMLTIIHPGLWNRLPDNPYRPRLGAGAPRTPPPPNVPHRGR